MSLFDLSSDEIDTMAELYEKKNPRKRWYNLTIKAAEDFVETANAGMSPKVEKQVSSLRDKAREILTKLNAIFNDENMDDEQRECLEQTVDLFDQAIETWSSQF